MFSIRPNRHVLANLSVLLLLTMPAVTHATSVRMETVLGPIDILLYDTAAPRTVANFLIYVNTASYNNSFIHHSAPGLTIQGGGYFWDDARGTTDTISTNAPVANEFTSSRSNRRGTIAMAKLDGNPDSATSQWFINLTDNGSVLDSFNGGYSVFGEVSASSMAVVDAIGRQQIINAGGAFSQLPVTSRPLEPIIQKSNLVMMSSVATSPNSYQGLWWNANESGWGMSITQHGNIIFAALYTYDDVGQPAWYVIPNCPVTTTNGPMATTSCNGDIYKVIGGTSPFVPWNGAGKTTAKVGAGTLTFPGFSTGQFDFIINNIPGSKAITEQIFATGLNPPAVDYTDLWWNPGESGWGVSLTQQFGMIFAAWYTYDANGKPVWYVVPNCPVVNAGCTGSLYQVTGGAPPYAGWDGTNPATAVGSATFAFGDSANGTMSYTLNNFASSRSITRQVF